MLKYILKRIIISIFLLLGVSVILYVLLRCMPTDFVEQRILTLVQNGTEVSEEFIQQMYHTYGLDGNIFVGYLTWLGNVFRGDFGNSFISQRPVLSEIFSADRIGTSFFVAFIAVIIALGQVDNFFGTHSEGETAIQKLLSYGRLGFSPNWQAVITGLVVVAVMLLWPKKWNNRVPSSLVGIVVAGLLSWGLGFDVPTVGEIPRTLLPQVRLNLIAIDLNTLTNLISPAFTIAALGMIESLLCGASASRMKNEPFDADQELIAQGTGNILIPFFGGVPSTAAIARTSVAIKSGCETRLTGVNHAGEAGFTP